MTIYMLKTCIRSFNMREHPDAVTRRLDAEVERGNRIAISAITYAEMRCGQISKKAPAKHKVSDQRVRQWDVPVAYS